MDGDKQERIPRDKDDFNRSNDDPYGDWAFHISPMSVWVRVVHIDRCDFCLEEEWQEDRPFDLYVSAARTTG